MLQYLSLKKLSKIWRNKKTIMLSFFLGKLVLSIPWKNLYSESTVVDIEDLHLVAKPNFGKDIIIQLFLFKWFVLQTLFNSNYSKFYIILSLWIMFFFFQRCSMCHKAKYFDERKNFSFFCISKLLLKIVVYVVTY